MTTQKYDVLIIGAGPSGSVAASYLHKNGVKVKVVEKTKFPRFVIGESLIPRVMDNFQEAGLLDCVMDKGFEKKFGARFIRNNKEFCLFDFSEKYGEGWSWTWQLPRADFDNELIQECIRKGVDVSFETEVIDVKFNGKKSTTTIKDKDGQISEIEANFIIDSSGYGRVLPRLLNLSQPSTVTENSSIFTHVKETNRPVKGRREAMTITFDILETKVWIWVIPFSNGNTSLGVVGPTSYINSLHEDPAEALRIAFRQSDEYRDRFEGYEFLFEPKKIENYSCAVKEMCGPGFTLTGNSAEFLDPVFSSGVCFATESGLLSAKLYLKEHNGEEVDWQTEYADYIQRGVRTFATYVKEWYTGNLQTLFFHRPENPEVKEKICSVLAGYVWDLSNPFVKKHDSVVKNLAYTLQMQEQE